MPTVYSPPVSTYVPLATYTVTGSPDSSITFSSIPATYRDLVLVVSGTLSATAGFRLRVNNDTGSNYSTVAMKAGASPSSEAFTDVQFYPSTVTSASGALFNFVGQFFDYSATDKHKTVLFRASLGAATTEANAARWANTAAINEIDIFLNTGSYNVGSTFSLYAIAA
jgi:hypothetical protein